MAKFISDAPAAADVVVIGGGPAGTAALWAIERAAPGTKTVLIEQSDKLGAGSSTASLENYRTCWPALCMARMMQRSADVLHRAEEFFGETLHLKERGYLFCAFTDKQADSLQKDVTHLHDMGMSHIEFLNTAEVRARFPWVGERVIAAKYDPTAGWLDSHALIYAFARSASFAQIVLGVRDSAIRVENGKVIGVKTSAGNIDSPVVIIACGAEAKQMGRTAGVDLPVVVRPRQSFTTPWRHENFPEDAPMLIGAAPYPHVRPEAQSGAIFGWEYTWLDKNTGQDALTDPIFPVTDLKDPRFPSVTLALLARQFGHRNGEGFAHSRYLRGLVHSIGYYVYRSGEAAHKNGMPYVSERALIDAVPEVEGLFASIAHVGHGIMSSPAAGEIIASRVLGLPLPDPTFADFGFAVPWVEYDENAL
ncbi:MAG: FAD-binding oxidoreductase [Anaerolineae bacterium]|nr:FAD-binding oxidoreductase [Anaerolineae bacterium]